MRGDCSEAGKVRLLTYNFLASVGIALVDSAYVGLARATWLSFDLDLFIEPPSVADPASRVLFCPADEFDALLVGIQIPKLLRRPILLLDLNYRLLIVLKLARP